MSKYRAKKTVINGITFDSKKEAQEYLRLQALEDAGIIKFLKLQPEFELQPKYRKNGKTIRAVKYIADFSFYDANGNFIVEDVKGLKTDVYKLKKKLFEYKYDYTITEV